MQGAFRERDELRPGNLATNRKHTASVPGYSTVPYRMPSFCPDYLGCEKSGAPDLRCGVPFHGIGTAVSPQQDEMKWPRALVLDRQRPDHGHAAAEATYSHKGPLRIDAVTWRLPPHRSRRRPRTKTHPLRHRPHPHRSRRRHRTRTHPRHRPRRRHLRP